MSVTTNVNRSRGWHIQRNRINTKQLTPDYKQASANPNKYVSQE